MSNEKTVGVGLIGCGFMGLAHLQAYLKNENARIAALCDAARMPDGDFSHVAGNVDVGEGMKLDMANILACMDYRELLDDPGVELIDICVPTFLHKEIAIAALEAGKHVLCEKPMALTSEDAREMVAAAEKATGFLMPAMCIRFWPEWAWLKRAIDGGAYGRVLGARFRRVAEPPGWGNFMNGDQSGGALLDLHIHDSDFVQYCFGRPKSVTSQGYTKLSGRIDHVTTLYEFESGAAVSAEGGWAMSPGFGFNMSFTVNFENATADYDVSRGAESLRLFVPGKDTVTPDFPAGDGYYHELAHIVECIREGRPPTVVTALDGLTSVELCEAEEKSIQTGERVAL